MCNSLFYDSNYAKRSSKYGREDGNYFSDFHRKLAEINFNWGISMHKYLLTPPPTLLIPQNSFES